MRRLLPLLALFLIAGCGGPEPKTLHRGPQSCIPKEGTGTMGACEPKPVGLRTTLSIHGPYVPDVSYYQGRPDWQQAKPHISGAIVRVADGNFNDPSFPYNWRELRRLHVWHAVYYFLRPGNCQGQADRAVSLVGAQGGLDSGPLIADAEVPLNYGCARDFVQRVERDTGWRLSVIYTAPGTWPGGPHGNSLLWVAGYGPSAGCVWTCGHVAWQYSDGVIGPRPHCTPGLGCGDMSQDTGITRLVHYPPRPPDRKRLHAQLLAAEARRTALRHALVHFGCRARVREEEPLGPRCRRWFAEGEGTNRQIAHLHRLGA